MMRVALVLLMIPLPALGQQRATPGLPEHVTPQAKAAVDAGLAFLSRVQNRDGSWVNGKGYAYTGFPVSMTALAGIALLMDGNTTTQGRYSANVDRACRYILSSTTSTGLIGRESVESRPMYGHGFSMLFLGELSGMVEDAKRQERIQRALRGAVQLAARSQSRLGGWLYSPDSRGDEGSVTITQIQGLRACRNGGVAVPKRVIDAAMNYLALSQNSDGGIAYTASAPGPSRPAITAAAVACWLNAGLYDSRRMKAALAYSKRTIRPEGADQGHYFYAHLYLAQSMYIVDDDDWGEYFTKLQARLVAMQQEDGSWAGDGVGEIYGTAIALTILQLPYNQLPIMQK